MLPAPAEAGVGAAEDALWSGALSGGCGLITAMENKGIRTERRQRAINQPGYSYSDDDDNGTDASRKIDGEYRREQRDRCRRRSAAREEQSRVTA